MGAVQNYAQYSNNKFWHAIAWKRVQMEMRCGGLPRFYDEEYVIYRGDKLCKIVLLPTPANPWYVVEDAAKDYWCAAHSQLAKCEEDSPPNTLWSCYANPHKAHKPRPIARKVKVVIEDISDGKL